jgi:uncharacterized membrane protein YkoI
VPQVIRLKSLRYILTSFAILLALITPLWADETEPDEVSRLLRQDEILPLATILELIRPVTGETILEVEVEHEDFGIAYEIYFLDPQGRRREIYVDARTGEIMLQKLDD